MTAADGIVAYQVKLLLELFICVVDTELFEAVDVKRFKAEDDKQHIYVKAAPKENSIQDQNLCIFSLPVNVQNAYEGVLLSRNLQRRVNPVDDAVEQMSIDLLSQGVPGIYCPLLGHRLHDRFSHQNDPPMAQPAHQPLCAHSQQVTEGGQVWIVRLKDIQVKFSTSVSS